MTRFNPGTYGMEEASDGAWVAFGDYATQAAELARVKEEHQALLDQQQEEIEGLLQQVAQLQEELDNRGWDTSE